MSDQPGAATVDHAEPNPDAEQRAREAYAAQVECEVEAIIAKLAGMKEALAAKKLELKEARAAAREG